MTQPAGDVHTPQDSLVMLGDGDLELSDPLADTRGCKVVGANDAGIGHVIGLLIDEATREVCFLQVGAGGYLGISARRFLIPIETVTHTTETTVYTTHASSDQVFSSMAVA